MKKDKSITMDNLARAEFPKFSVKNNSKKLKLPKQKAINKKTSQINVLAYYSQSLKQKEIQAKYLFAEKNNKLKNQKNNIFSEFEELSNLLEDSISELISMLKKLEEKDYSWILELLFKYMEQTGRKNSQSEEKKIFAAQFQNITIKNGISAQQSRKLLDNLFGFSDGYAKDVYSHFKEYPELYKSEWANQELEQLNIINSIILKGNIINFHGAGKKRITKKASDSFRYIINDSINYLRKYINNPEFQKENKLFFQDKENQFLIDYINTEFKDPIDFIKEIKNSSKTELKSNFRLRMGYLMADISFKIKFPDEFKKLSKLQYTFHKK